MAKAPLLSSSDLKLPLSLGEQRSELVRPCPFPLADCILGGTWPCLCPRSPHPNPLCYFLPRPAPLLPGHFGIRREKRGLCFSGCWDLEMTRKQDMCSPT